MLGGGLSPLAEGLSIQTGRLRVIKALCDSNRPAEKPTGHTKKQTPLLVGQSTGQKRFFLSARWPWVWCRQTPETNAQTKQSHLIFCSCIIIVRNSAIWTCFFFLFSCRLSIGRKAISPSGNSKCNAIWLLNEIANQSKIKQNCRGWPKDRDTACGECVRAMRKENWWKVRKQ